jgi:hypothetical protein
MTIRQLELLGFKPRTTDNEIYYSLTVGGLVFSTQAGSKVGNADRWTATIHGSVISYDNFAELQSLINNLERHKNGSN